MSDAICAQFKSNHVFDVLLKADCAAPSESISFICQLEVGGFLDIQCLLFFCRFSLLPRHSREFRSSTIPRRNVNTAGKQFGNAKTELILIFISIQFTLIETYSPQKLCAEFPNKAERDLLRCFRQLFGSYNLQL